ncbi:MAG: hypothetical protein KKC75_00935 [Nanoarchaeota archaeon]|nr:hypothetical protein [Nanoarchaeota archaeon]MBU1005052.1 hypothetical protein [Nanoarchaeota archaeon]MBU1946561.1 hypothetical protein [Nanoarchaeota archaeon]
MQGRCVSLFSGGPGELINLDRILEVERWIARDFPRVNLVREYNFVRRDSNEPSEPVIYSCKLVYSPVDGSVTAEIQFPIAARNPTMSRDEVIAQCEEIPLLLQDVLGVSLQEPGKLDELIRTSRDKYTVMEETAAEQAESAEAALNVHLSALIDNLKGLGECRGMLYNPLKLMGWFDESYKGPWNDSLGALTIQHSIENGLILPATFFYTEVPFEAMLPSSSGNLMVFGNYFMVDNRHSRDFQNRYLKVRIQFTSNPPVSIAASLAAHRSKGFFPQSVYWLLPYTNTLEPRSETSCLVDAGVSHGNVHDTIEISVRDTQKELWERLTHIFQKVYSMEMKQHYNP